MGIPGLPCFACAAGTAAPSESSVDVCFLALTSIERIRLPHGT